MLLQAVLVVVLSSCDTSEPSYTKQSFMNAEEHSNTQTLFKGMPRHLVHGNSIPELILRRSKPSFQPSIPNIHLTSQHKLETGAVPPQIESFTTGRTPNRDSLLITEGSNAPHKMSPNNGCACIRTPPSQKFTCQANMTCAIHMTSQNS